VTLFRHRYRIESARAQWWDYSTPGTYFITICTKNRQPSLGQIYGNHMHLSVVGQIALTCWHEIPRHQTIPVTIDACAILPDHIHGLLTLGYPTDHVDHADHADHADRADRADHADRVETQQCCVSTRRIQSDSIPSIIRNYKSAVTTYAHQVGADFAWQPRYHDTIVRNQYAYWRIHHYITHNVVKHARHATYGYHNQVIKDL
jgi:REP element-mobilizing transposase RayT